MTAMEERRRYIRLNSCFPVEFSLYFAEQKPVSGEYQGFTSNISEGGLCVSAKTLKENDIALILQKKVRLKLNINLPLSLKAVSACGDITWSSVDEKDPAGKTYLIGISYCDIKPQDRKRIVSYARRLKWLPRLTSLGLLVFLLSSIILSYYHINARRENQRLVKELVNALEAKAGIENKLNELKLSKEPLESRLSTGITKIEGLRAEITDIKAKTDSERGRVTTQLNRAIGEQERLREEFAKLSAESTASMETARRSLQVQLNELKKITDRLQIELGEITRKGSSQMDLLQERFKVLQEENDSLKSQVDIQRQGELSLEEQLAGLRSKSGELEKASIEKMLAWLKAHQIKKTGLVLSYEGDRSLQDYGFSYDQSLACQVFLISGEIKRAEKILDFYKDTAKTSDDLFYNAYDVKTGSPREYLIRTGPNIWIAIAACQYAKYTGNERYLPIAERIAKKAIDIQQASSDKSIKGSPDVEWVSTEHNLDAYALFNMLYELTGNERYREAQEASLGWLRDVGYNRPEGRFMRGRGDSTIATDTFSWAIAAIGPETLRANAMDPDGIMEFAENECKVSVDFYRPDDRTIKVTGFDFAKAQNLGRGGVISTEWTAQMIVAFKIMADYCKSIGESEKARLYSQRGEYYLSELGKMVISSPSPTGQGEGCLPYASIDNVDTGHGWRVAKGRRTGSVSATAYYIFAYKGYNPLTI